MNVHAHHDWADSMSDWAQNNPVTRRAFIPQGCDQQGRYEATIEPKPPVDRVREDYDEEPLTASESACFWAMASAPAIVVIGVAGFAIWVRFGHVW